MPVTTRRSRQQQQTPDGRDETGVDGDVNGPGDREDTAVAYGDPAELKRVGAEAADDDRDEGYGSQEGGTWQMEAQIDGEEGDGEDDAMLDAHEMAVDSDDYDDQDEEVPLSEDDRTEEEKQVVEEEIAQLEAELNISKKYRIVDKLGEGTFSAVYRAIDCQHPFYDNTAWLHRPSTKKAGPSLLAAVQRTNPLSADPTSASAPSKGPAGTVDRGATQLETQAGRVARKARASHTRTSSTASSGKESYQVLLQARKRLKRRVERAHFDQAEGGNPVYVALKRIYVTSSPARIYNELEILADLRNARNTCYLISALRHEDQVIAVMPYNRHQDFREYYRDIDLGIMRKYFKCLFSALADCHAQGIIHRDVKPANFLFDLNTETGTLCDFGLAQRFNPLEWHSRCLHSLPELWKTAETPGAIHGVKLQRPMSLLAQYRQTWVDWEKVHGSDPPDTMYTQRELPWKISSKGIKILTDHDSQDLYDERWGPVTRLPPGTKVGYLKPEYDKRPTIKANRAGTRGFRAPEVVLKCPDQTMALDIWSVGVMMLCILTRRFPFFSSNDDTEALVEIAAIFGKRRTEKCAALHNRTFHCNLPNIENPRFASLHELVQTLCPQIFVENMPLGICEELTEKYGGRSWTSDPEITNNIDHGSWYERSELYYAIELMRKCLTMDCTRRITAHDALSHPFITDDIQNSDPDGPPRGFRPLY